MWLLFLLLSVLFIWLLQKLIFEKFWDKGLTVSLSFSDPFIYEGDVSSLKETVTNSKRLPVLALSVRLSMSRDLEFLKGAKENSATSDQTYKRDIFSLLPKQKTTRTLPFLGKKRGCYPITSVDVSAFDYFFQKGYYKEFPQATQLFIYPKPVDIRRIALISQAISGMIYSKNRLFLDPFEFSGIREYQKSDPMNHINWKASARTGNLMVNQFDATTNFTVNILADMEDPYILKYEALLEESIRIAASLASGLTADKMPTRVCVNAKDSLTQTSIDEFMPAGGAQMGILYQKLACLDTSQISAHFSELLEKELASGATGETYVIISKNHTEDIVSALHALSKTQNQVLWVLPTMVYDMDHKFDDAALHILHWEVEL